MCVCVCVAIHRLSALSSRGGGGCVIVINSPNRLEPNGDTLGSSVVPAVWLSVPGSRAPDGHHDAGVIILAVGGRSTRLTHSTAVGRKPRVRVTPGATWRPVILMDHADLC